MNDKIFHSLACAFITCLVFVSSLVLLKICSTIRRKGDDDDDSNNNHERVPCCDRGDAEVVIELEQRHDHDDDVEIASSLAGEKKVQKERFHQQLCSTKICLMAVISGVVAMGVGIAKEVFDANELLWTGGTSSWGDILADFIGVVIGEVVIVVAIILRSHHVKLLSWTIVPWKIKGQSDRIIQSHKPTASIQI